MLWHVAEAMVIAELHGHEDPLAGSDIVINQRAQAPKGGSAMRRIGLLAIAVMALALSAVAYAAVVWTPEDGGSVGKGDVQLAFGWNNKAMQQNFSGVSFEYESSQDYEVVCEWITGPAHNRKRHDVTVDETVSVSASPTPDPRIKNQFVGWKLSAAALTGGDAPEVGDSCAGLLDEEGDEVNPSAVMISVEPTGTASGGGLYAVFGTQRVQIG